MLDKFDAGAFLVDQFLIKSSQRYPDITVDALELAFAWGESLGPRYVKRTQAQLERRTSTREKSAGVGWSVVRRHKQVKSKGRLPKGACCGHFAGFRVLEVKNLGGELLRK